MTNLIPIEKISSHILLIRGQKVILDRDLAKLYGVETRRLNEQVARNLDRFPSDFMFRLSTDEFKNLKSHFAISSWGGTRKPPRAFTEHGVAMLSSVLKSEKAVDVNILIIRAFVQMRELLYSDKELALRVEQIEKNLEFQGKTLETVIKAVSKLLKQPKSKPKKIGFDIDK
jgi:hypothetical protein